MKLCSCAVCGASLHHICMIQHTFLAAWVGDIHEMYTCLDCSLMCGVVQGKVPRDQVRPYTDQVTDFTAPTPLVVATLLTSESLQHFNHGDEATNIRCEKCDRGGDLLSCSFCNLVYHNKRGCLPKKWVISNELLNSSSYEWACPECLKKGAQMHQRKQVTPAGAVAAGKKRRRAR